MAIELSDLLITGVLALIAFLVLYIGNHLVGLPTPSTSFNQKWPPIDEDEFIRRCRPGVNREKALRVRKIIAEQLGFPYDQIYPEQNFVNDLGCD